MKQIFPDLWQTKLCKPFPFLRTHAYFLKTDNGNVLFYSTSHEGEFDHIHELGGITHQFLSHRHEVSPILHTVKDKFKSKLCCDSSEKPAIDMVCPVDLEFCERTELDNGILVIPTPGHTSGGCCYYYKSKFGRYLFTGDSFYSKGKGFSTYIVTSDGGAGDVLANSLQILRDCEPDVVFSSAFAGEPYVRVTPDFWNSEIDRNIKKLTQ